MANGRGEPSWATWLPAAPPPHANCDSPSRRCQAPAGTAARAVPARLHPRDAGIRDGDTHPSHRDRDGTCQALAGTVPAGRQPPPARGAVPAPASLHLKNPVPPRYLHTLRARFPSGGRRTYSIFICQPGFLFAILTLTGAERPRGRRLQGGWGGDIGERDINPPAAHPTGSRPLLEEPRRWKRQELPLKGLFQFVPAAGRALCGGGDISRDFGRRNAKSFSSSPPRPIGGRIPSRIPWETPGIRGKAWHCRGALEEGWSCVRPHRGAGPSRGGKGVPVPPPTPAYRVPSGWKGVLGSCGAFW